MGYRHVKIQPPALHLGNQLIATGFAGSGFFGRLHIIAFTKSDHFHRFAYPVW